jgi:vitamin B12 transporter
MASPLRLAAITALGIVSSTRLSAQQVKDSVRLAEIVVAASRVAGSARLRAAAADLLTSEELARRGVLRLEQALRLVPGAGIVATGAPGGTTSPFLRGVGSAQTLLLIDGIRVNDANALAGALLGGFELGPADRVEVVRGPQSTLFGGAAIGGAIAVASDPGARPTGLSARVEVGSFATYRGQASGHWTTGRLAAAGGASVVDTRNERPNNDYDQRTQQLRVTWQPTPRLAIGSTFRGLQQSYTSPGDVRTSNTTPVVSTRFAHYLGTAYADLSIARGWSTRLTTGAQDYSLRGRSRFDGGPEFESRLEATRWVADWQHRVRVARGVDAAAGLNAEWTTVTEGQESRDERLYAGYAEVSVEPGPRLALTGGLRGDDYTTFGGAVTGRVTVAYLVAGWSTKLRATIGTGFLPPSLSARYGGPFQRPNPDLRPERSVGWDLGADLFIARARGTIAITLFGNSLRDLIGFEGATFPALGRSVNVDRARTRGLELGARVELDRLDLRGSYTYTDAEDRSEPEPSLRRLIRRPRHSVSADAVWSPSARLELGAGLLGSLDREDSDFNAFPFARVNPGDFVDARASLRLRVRPGLAARVAIENLLNHRYEEVYGFPALGRRIRFGLDYQR